MVRVVVVEGCLTKPPLLLVAYWEESPGRTVDSMDPARATDLPLDMHPVDLEVWQVNLAVSSEVPMAVALMDNSLNSSHTAMANTQMHNTGMVQPVPPVQTLRTTSPRPTAVHNSTTLLRDLLVNSTPDHRPIHRMAVSSMVDHRHMDSHLNKVIIRTSTAAMRRPSNSTSIPR